MRIASSTQAQGGVGEKKGRSPSKLHEVPTPVYCLAKKGVKERTGETFGWLLTLWRAFSPQVPPPLFADVHKQTATSDHLEHGGYKI